MAPRKKPARKEPRILHPDEPTTTHVPLQVPPPSSTSISISSSSSSSINTARRRQGKMSNDDAAAAAAARSSTTQGASASSSSPDSVREPEVVVPPAAPSSSWATRNQWIVLAVASGACAAFNGVFAKLTTNNLTTHIAEAVSGLLGLSNLEQPIEYMVRAAFFGLNLVFNGVMWTLFTKALARGSSTTQVSIMNTSSNFVITAILGFAIFSESLPPLWWLGAALLVAGNVIIGRKDEGDGGRQGIDTTTATDAESSAGPASDEPLLGQRQRQPRYDGGGDAENVSVAAGIAASGVAAYGAAAQVDGTLPRVKKEEEEEEDKDVALIGDLNSDER